MKKKILSLCLVICLAAIAVVGGTLAYFTDTTENVDNTFTLGKVKLDLDEAPVNEDGKEISGNRVKENDYTSAAMVPGHVFDKDPTIHVEGGSEESYVFLDMTFNKYSSLFWVMAADASADADIAFDMFGDNHVLKNEFKNSSGVFSTTEFVKAMISDKDVFQKIIDKWFTGIEHSKWELCDIFTGEELNGKSDKYMTLRFAYKGDTVDNVYTVDASELNADIDIKFMDSFHMPTSVTQAMIEEGTTVGNMSSNFNTTSNKFNLVFKAYAIQADEIADLDAAYKAMFDLVKGATLSTYQ